MREVTFEKSLRYAKKDMIIKSDYLKEKSKKLPRSPKYNIARLIADEVPMPMRKIKDEIIKCFGHIEFIEIMSKSQFFVVEYGDDDNEER